MENEDQDMSSRENYGGYGSTNYEFHPVHVPVVAITVLCIICALRMLIRCLSRNSVKESRIYNRPSSEVARDAANPNRADARTQVPLTQEVSQVSSTKSNAISEKYIQLLNNPDEHVIDVDPKIALL